MNGSCHRWIPGQARNDVLSSCRTLIRHPFVYLFLLFFLFFTLPVYAKEQDMKVYPEELDAYNAYLKFKDVKARTLISDVLKKDSKSPVSYFVLGLLTREDEGDTTRALHYFKKSIEFAEAQCGKTPLTTNCVKWHSLAYQEKIEALKSLDRAQEAYESILHYDTLYDPKLNQQKIWPLIKMRRLDEAEAFANKILKEGATADRLHGLNSLCVLSSERNQRILSDQVCTEAGSKIKSMVIQYNTAIAKFSIFDLPAAEIVARHGTTLPNDMYGSAWEILIYQYTLENRFSEALSAAKQASEVHRGFSGLKEELSRAHFLNAISQLLFALGRPEDAYRLAHESHELPDRTGKVSGNPRFDQLMNDAYYSMVLKTYAEYLNEAYPQLTWKEKLKNMGKQLEIKFTRYLLQKKIKKLLQEQDLLVRLVTPYPPSLGPLETLPYWLVGSLVEITGEGVFLQALQTSQARETELLDKSKGYYLAALTQERFLNGDYSKTLEMAELALEGLPIEERLQRDLLKTLLAYSNYQLGQYEVMKGQYIELLRSTPSFLRVFQLKLPVKFTVEPGKYSDAAYQLLKQSPRFKNDSHGINLNIQSGEDFIFVCLMDDYHSMIHCTRSDVKNDQNGQFTVEKGVQSFLLEAFAPKIDLSQLDVNTLNGVPTKGIGSEQIQNLLGTP